ncbi:MAG: alginate O-acetyltransferase AlgX-related protein [Thermoanaerobaculia bacterium]
MKMSSVLVPGLVLGFLLAAPSAAAPAAPPKARAARPAAAPAPTREESIASARKVLLAQLAASGAGSWDAWSVSVEPFRAALREKIAAAKPNNPSSKGFTESRYEVLESLGEPKRFEAWPSSYLRYVANAPVSTSEFLTRTAFVSSIETISRWLASRGVDFIFVPVPKMTEVYPDAFVAGAPADRVVAPQMRRAIVELLDRNVEVVDLLPLFLEARKRPGAPSLYQHADPHWAWEAQKIALEEVVRRLRRYPEVRRALAAPRRFRTWTERRDLTSVSAAFGALTPEQARRVRPFLTADVELVAPVGAAPLASDTSPIALAGDSFNNGLEGGLAARLNMPIRDLHASGGSLAPFKDLLRDPESMKSMRVLIFLVNNQALWEFPATLPGEIAKHAAPRPTD